MILLFSTSSIHTCLWRRDLEPQDRLGNAVLILRGSELDLRFRLLSVGPG